MPEIDDKCQHHQTSGTDTAVNLLMNGYMCSEAILMAFGREFGLEPELGARIGGGLAGGLAQGKTCGAVTAAIMIIGLRYGAGIARDSYAKDLCFAMTQEFCHRFATRRQTLECSEILALNGIDHRNPGQMRNLREKGICDGIVRDAAEILEAMLQEEG